MDDDVRSELLALTADIVSAHVANTVVAARDVAGTVVAVHDALRDLVAPGAAPAAAPKPAVPIRASIRHDHLVCLEDGRTMTMPKRYLRTRYAMTSDDYRAKWGLPRDYPMVAPAYAERRRGLAQRVAPDRGAAVAPPDKAPRKRGRPRGTSAPAGA